MEGADKSFGDSKFSRLSQDTSRKLPSPLANEDSDSVRLFLGDGDTHIFSSSLPALFHKKLNLLGSDAQYVDRGVSLINGEVAIEKLRYPEDMESQIIGNLFPDDEEEFFAGISDSFDFLNSSNNLEEPEDFDLFRSGGGLEMDGDNTKEAFGLHMNTRGDLEHFTGGCATHPGSLNGAGSVIGEHPYGEHPSRTLFVRNINSNVEDSELRALFEQYGAIRTLYTACKHRGFVMISYYDIRAARSAMRSLQNKPLRRRKLDIHFSIPKDNPSDKDINQGTLVVFNLDSSVSNDDLRHIFGAYGEVKEIRETPHKRHHKFIEFYDVRAAEAALRALNRSDIAGKMIKLEPSRPGGARRSLMQQLNQDLEQEETRLFRQQASSPHIASPSGHSFWGHVGSPIHNDFIQGFHHLIGLGTSVPSVKKPLVGIPVNLPYTNPGRIETIGSHLECSNYIEANHSHASVGLKAMQVQHPHSFPEYGNGFMPFYTSAGPASVHSASALRATQKGMEGIHLPQTTTDGLGNNLSLFEQPPGAVGIARSGSIMHQRSVSGRNGSLSGPQFLWGNPNHYQQSVQNSPPVIWSTPNFNPAGHSYGYSGICSHLTNTELCSHHRHIGSVPSFAERHFGCTGELTDTLHGVGLLVPAGVSGNSGGHAMTMRGGHGVLNPGVTFEVNGEIEGKASADFGIISPQCNTRTFQTGGHPVPVSGASEMLAECGRIHRIESSSTQVDNKKQYRLDIDRILCGEDTRTTLMIKNIPNKYTSKMLLAAIDENHHGTYDFLYLPIDFKNKCNVGYAFINMTAPQHIIPFYEALNGKRWEKFNSEKVASLAYARIQGKAALVAHFQNSSLMNEDKRCRPILLYSDGQAAGDQQPFPLGVDIQAKGNKGQNGNGDPLDCFSCSSNTDGSGQVSAGSRSSEKLSNSPEENGD